MPVGNQELMARQLEQLFRRTRICPVAIAGDSDYRQ
jgi:hypothetical protein